MITIFKKSDLNYQKNIQNLNFYLALSFAFIMPISKKALPYIIGLWFLTWILEGNYKTKFANIKNKLLFFAAIAFYSFHVFGLLYSRYLDVAFFDIQIKISLLFSPLVFASANTNYKIKSNEILLSFVIGSLVASLNLQDPLDSGQG